MFFRRKKTSRSRKRRSTQASSQRLRPRATRKRSPRKTKRPVATKTTRNRPSRSGRLWASTKRSLVLIITGVILFVTAHFLFISNTLDIADIVVIEDEEVQTDHPLEVLLSDLKGTNLMLLKTNQILPSFEGDYSHYESISIQKNLPDTLVVKLITYPVISNIEVQTPDDEVLYFSLNSNGQTIETIESPNNNLPLVVIERDQSIGEGANILTQAELAFILEAEQNFEDKFGMEVLHILFQDVEREAHLWTERNFYVWLDVTGDLDQQLNKLKRALPKLDIYEENLDYIDLRIQGVNGEKVIFKRSG